MTSRFLAFLHTKPEDVSEKCLTFNMQTVSDFDRVMGKVFSSQVSIEMFRLTTDVTMSQSYYTHSTFTLYLVVVPLMTLCCADVPYSLTYSEITFT